MGGTLVANAQITAEHIETEPNAVPKQFLCIIAPKSTAFPF